MNRFFVAPEQVKDQRISIIDRDDIRHITKVLRLGLGDTLQICDGLAWEYIARIEALAKDAVVAEVCQQQELQAEPSLEVVLLQGIPKGEKFDFIIQKATELGIKEIIPIQAKRSVAKVEPQKAAGKVERWQRIAYEAAKQCKRGRIPVIREPLSFSQVATSFSVKDIILIPWEEEYVEPIGAIFGQIKPTGKIFLIIGPEGGLDESEVALLKEAGGKTVTLGPRILRTETAAIAATTLIMYAWGDLGGVSK